MKLSILTLCVASAAAHTFASTDNAVAFANFKKTFNKQYLSNEEHSMRASIFENTLARISAKRAAGDSTAGVTKFSDLTRSEFKQKYLTYKPVDAARRAAALKVEVHNGTLSAAPTSFDWRAKSAVTPVKDQGQCGSCWAFSATEQIESQWYLAGNSLTSFAPQQIVSCDKTDAGCDGGDTPTAFEYVEGAGGLATEASYPYTSGGTGGDDDDDDFAKKGKLSCLPFKTDGGKISGYSYATPTCTGACENQDLDILAVNLASTAPVSICVNAEAWQDYDSGVLTKEACGAIAYDDLDHCVQLVGYTADYWIVRNSWNTDWGVEGYIHLARADNTCGLADEATFVKIAN